MDEKANKDDDLSVMWRVFVEKLTGIRDASNPTALDVESATATIASMIPQETATAKKTRHRFQTSLQYIKVLGGVAAEGASVAFGPANTCFSAITLVIEAIQRANQSFEDLEILLDCICGFLGTLETNLQSRAQEQTSRTIRLVCFNILQEFLWVLDRVLELTNSGSKRFKHLTKTAFTGDNVIRASLGRMAKLIEDFMRTAIADILAKVNTGVKDFEKVQRDVKMVVEHQRLQNIHQALNLGLDNSDKLNKDHHDKLSSRAILGTGDWILSKEYFQSWSDVSNPTAHPVLCIGEVAQTGKTFLSNRIIRHLMTRPVDENGNKVAVAYYYFSSKVEELSPGDVLSAHSRALRNIIWQFANADSEFADNIDHTLSHGTDLPLNVLWQSLCSYSRKSSTILFIVFDGLWTPPFDTQAFIETMISDILSTNPSATSPPNIRLNLSGRHRFFELLGRFPYQLNHPSWIPFAGEKNRHNASDINLIIDHRLSGKGFQLDLCERIKRTMVECLVTTNLFEGLRDALSAIEKQLVPSRIDVFLARFRAESKEVAKKEAGERIKRLADLGPWLKEELNSILVWVVAGGSDRPPSLKLVKQVLSRKNQEQPAWPLENRLRHNYFHLLNLGPNGNVHFWANIDVDGYMDDQIIKEQLQNSPKDIGSSNTATTSTAIVFEIESFRAALKFLSSPEVYARLGFEDFFSSKLGAARRGGDRSATVDHVRLDRNKSHLEVVQTCLDVICECNAKTIPSELEIIASSYLHVHLEKVNLQKLEKNVKQEVATKLIRIFFEEAIVKVWWTDERAKKVDLDAFCNAVARWLSDADVADIINNDNRANISTVVLATEREIPNVLFEIVRKASGKDSENTSILCSASNGL